MEVERKQRAEKSVVIVERLVRVQLRAMGCERFDIGIKRDGRRDDSAGRAGRSRYQGNHQVASSRKCKGAHIYVRPAGRHPLSLIDDP